MICLWLGLLSLVIVVINFLCSVGVYCKWVLVILVVENIGVVLIEGFGFFFDVVIVS